MDEKLLFTHLLLNKLSVFYPRPRLRLLPEERELELERELPTELRELLRLLPTLERERELELRLLPKLLLERLGVR